MCLLNEAQQIKKSCVTGVLKKEPQGGFCWNQVNVQGCRGFDTASHGPTIAGTYLHLLWHFTSQDSKSAAHGEWVAAFQRCCIAQQLSLLLAQVSALSESHDRSDVADLGSNGPPPPLFYPPLTTSLLLSSVFHRVTASFSEALMIPRPESKDLTNVHVYFSIYCS